MHAKEKLHDSDSLLELNRNAEEILSKNETKQSKASGGYSVFFTPKVIYARHQINWHLQFTSWEIFLYLVEMECVGGS